MAREDQQGDEIHGVVHGTVSGPVAIGKDIEQTQTVGTMRVEVTEAELGELRQEFADLREQVAAAAPQAEQQQALQMVDDLEKDTISDRPKPVTMRYVRDWLIEHVPKVAGAVTAIVINPIVGVLVSAAGDAVVAEFQQLIGADPGSPASAG